MDKHVSGNGVCLSATPKNLRFFRDPGGRIMRCDKHSLPLEIVKFPCEFNGFLKRLFYLRRKNPVDIISCESACGNKKKRGGNKREDNKNSHEFRFELVSQDFIAPLHIKLENVFSYKKHQCQ